MNIEDITVGPVTSPADLIDLEELLWSADASGAQWAFRGQTRPYGTLVPSFQRIFVAKKSVGTAHIIERDLIAAFRKHYAELPGKNPDMPVWSDRQRITPSAPMSLRITHR